MMTRMSCRFSSASRALFSPSVVLKMLLCRLLANVSVQIITLFGWYTQVNEIVPDAHGDWLNQRDSSFSRFIRIGGKKANKSDIFVDYSNGVKTNRDAWVFNSSIQILHDNIKRTHGSYSLARALFSKGKNIEEIRNIVGNNVSWTRFLLQQLRKQNELPDYCEEKIQMALYRPFFKQFLYYEKSGLIEVPGRWKKFLPTSSSKNLIICSTGVGSKEFSCLMTNCIVDLQLNFNGQCFPRWLPGEQAKEAEDTFDFGEPSEMPSGFSPEALPHFQAAYLGKPITEDDLFYYIYGILHSEDYRTRYANNLMKELPRIPRVATYEQFMAFVEAGQELARLHVHFEDVAPYAGIKFEYTKVGQPSYRVTQMKWGKIKGKTGNAAKDKTTLIYNDWITVKNIPLEAQEYVVNKKSAVDWVVERACVSIDKASGIVNDFNDYAAEMGSERYPLDLFLKVITVSLETMKIVKTLPKLEIHPLDK